MNKGSAAREALERARISRAISPAAYLEIRNALAEDKDGDG